MKFTAWTVSIYSIVCIIPRPLVEIRDVMNEEVLRDCVSTIYFVTIFNLAFFSSLFYSYFHYTILINSNCLNYLAIKTSRSSCNLSIFLHFDLVINRKIDITKQVVFIFLKQFSAVSNISNLVTSSYNGTPNNKTESGEIHEEDGPRVCILVIIS